MKGRKEAFGASSAGSKTKSRTGSQAAAKSSAQQRTRAATNIESSHGGSSLGSRKSAAGKGGAQHK